MQGLSENISDSDNIGLDLFLELTFFQWNELIEERIIRVMERLGERFAGRLGLDSASVIDAHLTFVAGIQAQSATSQG